MGHSNHNLAIKRHCTGVTKSYPIQTAGGTRDVRIITEAGVYALAMHSTIHGAKKFQQWVYDVIAQLREKGVVDLRDKKPDTPVQLPSKKELALMVVEAEEAREAAEKETKRLNHTCNNMVKHDAAGQTPTQYCKHFNGVNTSKVQKYLVEKGALTEVGDNRGYKAVSYTRDNYFKQKSEIHNDIRIHKVELTQRGCKWLTAKYFKGELPMKKSWDGEFYHTLPEDSEVEF